MSEFLAEAQVLIQANTRAFRAELAAALATVPKAIEIPIVAVGGGSAASVRKAAAAATTELSAATALSTKSLNAEAVAAARAGSSVRAEASANQTASRAAREAATRRNEITKGLQAQALSAVGLRGAIIGANTAFLAATAGAILFGKSLQSAAQFQTELATFAATTGATAGQIQQVSDAAKQLGADLTLPGVNAQDAAVAMTELAKAGLSVEESISGARGVLQLATAAGIDNAAATELAASALNSFGLAGGEAVHVADVLANSANDAQGSITDIGIALQQASAAGRQAGLSLEETTGILTIFARNGIKGSDAGTLLRTMLIRLINPTDKANEVIQRLGLHIRDATGGVNLGFFDEFARKTKNLTAAERDRDAAIIAGQDAFRGLSILARTGGAALDQQVTALNESGTAAELAAARTSGLAGAAENLKNQLATAGLALGQSLAPGLTDLANLTAEAIGTVHNLVVEIKSLSDQAARPIDIVVNVIRKATGGGGGGDQQIREDVQGRIRNILSLSETAPEFLGDVNALANEANAVLEDKLFRGAGLTDFPTLKQARQQIHDLITELNKTPGPTTLNQTVVALQKIQQEMAGGTFGTKQFAQSLGPFIEQLQKLSTQPVELPTITFPKSLEAGARAAVESGGKEAGVTGAHAFAQEFIPSMGNAFKSAATAGWQAFQDAAATNAAETAAKIAAAIRSATAGVQRGAGRQAGLEDLFNQILLGGGSPQEQTAGLQKQFSNQQAIIDKATKGLEGLTSGDKGFATLIKAVRTARAKQVAIQNQITQINEQAASDAKQKATAAQQAATKADQAVIDSFSTQQNRISLATISANATARLSDDVALQTLIITTAKREQKIISDTVKDADTRNAQLATRAQTIKAARVERRRLLTEIANNAVDTAVSGTDAFQADVNLAEAQGNLPAQIRFINIRIRAIDKLIAAGKQEGAALDRLKAGRATLQQKREDIQNQQIQDRIALGQSIEDLTGNKNPLVQALDAAIAETRQDIAAAKKAGRSTVVLQTELNNFLAKRKEVLEGAADKAKDATTAFDLLKEANDTFNKSAGNLINGNQPFAGPTGFTADIAQFLIRRQQPTAPTSTSRITSSVPPVPLQDQPLIQAIEKLTDAIVGSTGNASTAGGTASARASRKWHSENMLARQFQEG